MGTILAFIAESFIEFLYLSAAVIVITVYTDSSFANPLSIVGFCVMMYELKIWFKYLEDKKKRKIE